MFIAVLFVEVLNWKLLKSLSAIEYIHLLWYILQHCRIENKLLIIIHKNINESPQHIVDFKSQTQKPTYHMAPLIWRRQRGRKLCVGIIITLGHRMWLERNVKEDSGVPVMFYFLIWELVQFVKTQWVKKHVQFSVCMLHWNESI